MGENISESKREKIKRQIESLLKMAQGQANEFEARDALLKARQLMMKYHMEEDDVAIKTTPQSIVTEKSVRYTNLKLQLHHLMIASLLAKNFRCKHWYKTQEVVFLGFEEDAIAARELLVYLTKTLESSFKTYLAADKKVTPWKYEGKGAAFSKSVKRSWVDGFILGLMDALEKQTASDPGYALMIAVPQEVTVVYEKKKFKKGAARGHRGYERKDSDAFLNGRESAIDAMNARSLSAGKPVLEG